MNKKLLGISITTLFVALNFVLSHKPDSVMAAGNSFYVSTTGSDTNNGSVSAPFKTFAKGISTMTAGDKLYIYGGTYTERLVTSKSGNSTQKIEILPYNNQQVIIDGTNSKANLIDMTGSFVEVSGIEVKNSTGYCVNIVGSDNKVSNLRVHDCSAMGIYTNGKRNKIIGNTVYLASMVNSARTMPYGWGSGIKVRVGGDGILIENNTVYNNYGEGIAVTRGINSTVRNNKVYDNYAANLYIDNSYNILVEKNLSWCTGNVGFQRNGKDAYAISIGEEQYTGWGAQLRNVVIKNNIGINCYKGVGVQAADVPDGGLDTVTIVNNTFWGNKSNAFYLDKASNSTKQRNSVVANNIFHTVGDQIASVLDASGITFKNNYWSGKLPPTNVVGLGDKNGVSPFASTTLGYLANDYKLANGSMAVNAGYLDPSVIDDYFGNSRPYGASLDMGAHELTDAVVVTPTAVATPLVKQGDANNDGLVDNIDYQNYWLPNYNKSVTCGSSCGDFDNNGLVNGIDYVIWLNNYGK